MDTTKAVDFDRQVVLACLFYSMQDLYCFIRKVSVIIYIAEYV